jgi:dUTP pyrophosphatase
MSTFAIVDNKFRKYPQEEIKIPYRKTVGSAGYDIFSPIDVEIPAKGEVLLWTDIKVNMENNLVFEIYIRSSLAIKKNITLKNAVGIIDSDFSNNRDNDGNIGICLVNNSILPFQIKKSDAVAQGIFKQYFTVVEEVKLFSDRVGGIGSTSS